MTATGFTDSYPFALSRQAFGPLRELIGDARIVAIGENNHHIAEFNVVRDQVLRFLVEELGFGVLGFESGFAEGRRVDDWIRGGGGDVTDVARDGFTFSLGDSAEMHGMLRWMREYNSAGGRVRYSGLDVAASAGSPEPSLRAVREYFEEHGPNAMSIVDTALAATARYSGASSAVSPARYAALPRAERDRATAALAGVVAHLDTLAAHYTERSGAAAFASARHNALGAVRLDGYLGELEALTAGTAGPVSGSARDTYMAETVRLLRDLHGPDERIVVMLHNGHLQRVPVPLTPASSAVSAGTQLASAFGDDYFALALTAGEGTTTGLAPKEGARLGFEVHELPLDPPAPGTVEHELAGGREQLLDLRAARRAGTGGPRGIRHATITSDVAVADAFDALVYLPYMQVSGFVRAEA